MKWTVKKATTVAIIGARHGSKAIPKKNITDVGGFPLLAYSIAAAKLTKGVERIIVSTDIEEFAEIARQFGAEVPFLRPAEAATDHSVDRDFIVHALTWLQEHEGSVPEFLLFLRPTSPLRDPKKVSEALEMLKSTPEATSLRSAHPTDFVPQKVFGLEDKYFIGLFPDHKQREYHALPRQAFPPTFKPDGYVDVLRSDFILSHPDLTYGDRILAFHTPDTGDIDRQSDLEYVRKIVQDGHWEIYEYLKTHYPQKR